MYGARVEEVRKMKNICLLQLPMEKMSHEFNIVKGAGRGVTTRAVIITFSHLQL